MQNSGTTVLNYFWTVWRWTWSPMCAYDSVPWFSSLTSTCPGTSNTDRTSFYPHPRICSTDFREWWRERERKKNTDVRDKHRSIASSTHPDRGLNPQPRHMPWPGITPATFWCTGQHCNKLSHPVRATDSTFILSWYTVIQYVKNITVYLVTPMSFFLHLFISTNSFTQMNFLPSWIISSGYI